MSKIARPRRSALYMPASNAKAVDKARTLDADVIILDLEDAVAPEMKVAAREAAVAAVRAGGFGPREIVIRTNGLDTPWGADDLAAAAAAGPDAVLVPKVNDAADVHAYDAALAGAPAETRLWTMIETAKAAFHLWEIAGASQTTRLSTWVMGVNDFAKEMRARQTPDRAPFLPLLTLSVAAARTHGLTVLDGVHNDIENLEALEAVCVQGVDFGFDGKTLIHPKHLEICNRVFSPSADEIAWSQAVIAAFADPENAGKGALRVEGKMAERLHLAQAERLVAVAAAIAARAA
ncbi:MULTISPECIES: HpcH/HpaI aldolase/citrate lyase family protein [unclassified Caulobacter]|uniref:HpcH/HpaI aldolase/citrate lyase family protein n=1 Tax=unclassified Caulobacter TaxID=2648921 RepID=UPI000D3A2C82|nr:MULTISPECIES: CoA ester lyase [unclassified Caulobacter]PTS81882.1 CoA ester lyase [Caulobacter sp. HMWF009]PTT06702.1 CoA ester lyase [Caulobacter sp. HMWF025]